MAAISLQAAKIALIMLEIADMAPAIREATDYIIRKSKEGEIDLKAELQKLMEESDEQLAIWKGGGG